LKEQFRTNIHEENSDIKAEILKNQVNLPYNMDLLSILNDAVIITDENFKITYWNPAATEVYSWNSSEVVGKKVKDVLKTRFIDIEEPKTVQKLVKTGSFEDEVIQFTKKNFPLYISTKIVAIKDVNNVINGYIYINRDMTAIKNTEKKLKRNYNILNSIIENTTDAVYLKNLSGNYIMANTTHSEIVGKPVSEIIGKNDWELFPSKDADVITRDDKEIIENIKTVTYEETLYSHRERAIRNYITTKGPYRGYDDTILGIFGIGRDITHLKSAEKNLIESEDKYRNLFATMLQGVVYYDYTGKIISMNPAAEKIMGYTIEEIHGKTSKDPIWQCITENGKEFLGENHPSMLALETGSEVEDVVMGIRNPGVDEYKWLRINAVPQFHEGETKPYQVYTTFNDITSEKKAKSLLKNSEKQYRTLFDKIAEGFALHEIVCNKNDETVDFRFIDINPAFEELTGIKREDLVGKLKSKVISDDSADWTKIYDNLPLNGNSIRFDKYFKDLNKYYNILAFSPAINRLAILFSDITERQIVENELKETMHQLKLSNSELEEFAYITSHDLKEPLRMISSFLQLLQRRYQDKLDEDANEFIEFAVDGAIRLNELLDDLMVYSRLNSNSTNLTIVDFGEVLDIVKVNLDILINENDAIITSDNLPVTIADKTQMIQLFQNLISNSIKYRGEENPVIHISAEKDGNNWLFALEDNGIGIQPEYSEKIFKIFQKLHGPQTYDGTGIGLSISKRIVEKHGGNIWIDTDRINGTKFNFSLRSG
jgi:PAS domain S-box-containing protein